MEWTDGVSEASERARTRGRAARPGTPPAPRRPEAMALSEAQVFGYSTNVQELYLRARKALEDGHVDVDGIVEELKYLHDETAQANAVQEEAKRRLKEATEAFAPLKLAL